MLPAITQYDIIKKKYQLQALDQLSVKNIFVSLAAERIVLNQNQKKQTEMETNLYTNELIHESSPYLLQHAHNPVNWYPWGDKALKKAKRENKRIIISYG